MNAIDTNVFAYALDASEPHKRAAALALLSRLTGSDAVLLWQVACELGSVIAKFQRRGRTSPDAQDALTAVRSRYPLVLPDESVLDTASALRRDRQLAYWDSLLIAACIAAGVQQLHSEDLTEGAVIEGVRITNPFSGL